MNRVADKVASVTGAGSGLGEASSDEVDPNRRTTRQQK